MRNDPCGGSQKISKHVYMCDGVWVFSWKLVEVILWVLSDVNFNVVSRVRCIAGACTAQQSSGIEAHIATFRVPDAPVYACWHARSKSSTLLHLFAIRGYKFLWES